MDFKELKAQSLFQNEDYEEYLKVAEELVNISPNDTIYLAMSIAYHKIGDFDNMARCLELSGRYNPSIKKEVLKVAKENLALVYDENSVEDNIAMGFSITSSTFLPKPTSEFIISFSM